jgi:hypothetical protein
MPISVYRFGIPTVVQIYGNGNMLGELKVDNRFSAMLPDLEPHYSQEIRWYWKMMVRKMDFSL